LQLRFLIGGLSVLVESALYVYVADRELDYETAYYATRGRMDDVDGSKKQRSLKEKMYAYRYLGLLSLMMLFFCSLQLALQRMQQILTMV